MKKSIVACMCSAIILAGCSAPNVTGSQEKFSSAKGRAVTNAVVHGGVYKIQAKCSGKVIDVADWSETPGTNIHQWEYVGGANQQWFLHEAGDGTYTITSNFNGLCLNVENWIYGAGGNINQYTNNHLSNQKWYFDLLDDGCYRIRNMYSGKVLDVSNADKENGVNIQQWDWNGTDAQRWILTKLEYNAQEGIYVEPDQVPPAENETEPVVPPVKNDNQIVVEGKTYNLSFSDDFNGNDIDYSKWQRCPEWQRQDLGGYWENDCSYVKDGNLVIECRNNNGRLESGAVRTNGKFQQNKGVYKIRFKAEKSSAVWYAFWLMTDDEGRIGNGAVDGAEIDIFEIIANDPWMPKNQKKYLNSAVHWDGYGDKMRSASSQHFVNDSFFNQWHEATFIWTDYGYKLYLDDNETPVWDAPGANYGGTCQTENYIKITAEFGTWGGPVDNSLLPAHFYVDWVKVYE